MEVNTNSSTIPVIPSPLSSLLSAATSLIGPAETTTTITSNSNEIGGITTTTTMAVAAAATTTVTTPSNSKNMKHFKKSMIVEYERIESNGGVDESSHSSTASSSSSNSNSSSSHGGGGGGGGGGGEPFLAGATSFANTVISKSSSQHHHHHHSPELKEKKTSESHSQESSKKRKRKSIDEMDKNVIMGESSGSGSGLSVVKAAAVLSQFNSDLYEDESGDSMDHNQRNETSSTKTTHHTVKKSIIKKNIESNEISSGELSDGNTRSDFEMPLNEANTSSSKLKEVKRKKFNDTSLVENNSVPTSSSSSSNNNNNKKVSKSNETEGNKKDPSNKQSSSSKLKNPHSTNTFPPSSSSSSTSNTPSSKSESLKKNSDKPSSVVVVGFQGGETKEPKVDKKNQEVYCICKSSDSTRFMIACDKCDEWYHGDCVGVTQSLSKKIKAFFCHLCRQKNSSLKIKYKSQFNEMSKNLTKENVRQQENTPNGENLIKFFKETQARKKKEAELLKGLTNNTTTTTAHSSSSSSSSSSTLSSEKKHSKSLNPTHEIANTLNPIKNEPNTETNSSTKLADESKNKTVFDSPTMASLSLSSSKLYGKTNVSGEDIANFFSAITKLSNDVQLTTSASSANTTDQVSSSTNEVKSTSSPRPKNNHISSSSVSKKNKTDSDSHDESVGGGTSIKRQKAHPMSIFNNSENSNSAADDERESDSNDTSSINTNDVKDTNNDSADDNKNNIEADDENNDNENEDEDEENNNNNNESSDSDFSGFDSRHPIKSRRKSEDSQRSSMSNNLEKKNPKNKQLKTQNKKSNANAKKQPLATTSSNTIKTKQPKVAKPAKVGGGGKHQSLQKKRINRHSSSTNHNDLDEYDQASNDKSSVLEKKGPRQCLGPECVREAYESSKYCSYECGMRLAKDRLVNFLKTRLDQYNDETPLSTRLNQTELERCNYEIDHLKKHLSNLEKKHDDLDKVIERANFEKINPNVEKEREKLIDSSETEIYCVTCGQICSERHALKHMEKCFNKLESQAFFGSFYKTHIEGKSMFCDFYNTQTKMYCKRLKVMCPEHEKEKKVNDDEVCGCPLPRLIEYDDQPLDSTNIELCLAPKRTCSIHFKWEKLRRAQIDLEKLRAWLKMEELLEQKKLHETSLTQRGGLLSVLLHQTTSTTQMDTESGAVEIRSMNVDMKNETAVS